MSHREPPCIFHDRVTIALINAFLTMQFLYGIIRNPVVDPLTGPLARDTWRYL